MTASVKQGVASRPGEQQITLPEAPLPVDITQFGHSLYHAFLDYCKLGSPKKGAAQQAGWVPKLSLQQFTALASDLALLAPRGPLQAQVVSSIHARCRPAGSNDLTFAAFLQAISGLAASAEVPPDAVFAATATLAQERPSREVQDDSFAIPLHSSISYVASPGKRPLSAEKRPARPTTAPLSGTARNQRQGSKPPRNEASERFSNLKVNTTASKVGSFSSHAWQEGLYDEMIVPVSPNSIGSSKEQWYIKAAASENANGNEMPAWAQKLLDRMVSLETQVCSSKLIMPGDGFSQRVSPLTSPKVTPASGNIHVAAAADGGATVNHQQQQLTAARQVADMYCSIERLAALLSGLADRQAALELKVSSVQPHTNTNNEGFSAEKTATELGSPNQSYTDLSGRVTALGTSCSTLSAHIAAISQVASSAYAASKEALTKLDNTSSTQDLSQQCTEAMKVAESAVKQTQEFEVGMQSLRQTLEALQAQQMSAAALQQPSQRGTEEAAAMQAAIKQLQSEVAAIRKQQQEQPSHQQQSEVAPNRGDVYSQESLEALRQRMDEVEHSISCSAVLKSSNDALVKQLQQRVKKLEGRVATPPPATTSRETASSPAVVQADGNQIPELLNNVESQLQTLISTVNANTEQIRSGHCILQPPSSTSSPSCKLTDPQLQKVESALQHLSSSMAGGAAMAMHSETWHALVHPVDQLQNKQRDIDASISKSTKAEDSKLKDLGKRLTSVESKVSKLTQGESKSQLTTQTNNNVTPAGQSSVKDSSAGGKESTASEQVNAEYVNLVDGKLAQLQAQLDVLSNQIPILTERIGSAEQQSNVGVSQDAFVSLAQQVDAVVQQLSDLQSSCTAAATSSTEQGQTMASSQAQLDSLIERLDQIEGRSTGDITTIQIQVLEATIQRVGQQLDDLQHLDGRVAELAQDLQRLSEEQQTIQKAKADSWDASIKDLAGKVAAIEEDIAAQKEARKCIAAAATAGTSSDGQPAAGGNLSEEIVQQVCEFRGQAQSKGPQGYVPREEMMRALGTMATELTGRVKDIKSQVESERSSRSSLHRQVSSKEDLVRAVAKSGMELKTELERVKQAMEIYQVRLQDVEASVQEKASAVPDDNNNMQDTNREAIVALQQYAEGNFRGLAHRNEQLESRVQQHEQRLAALDYQQQQQQQALHTAPTSSSDSRLKPQLDAATHKVDEVASALVMVAEKMNDRINKLEGQVNNMNSTSPMSHTNQNKVQPPVSPSLAFGVAPTNGYGQGSHSQQGTQAPSPHHQQDASNPATAQSPMRGGGSGAYLPGMQRPQSSYNAEETVAASRPKSAQEKVALLVAEQRGQQKRLEQQLKSDEERIKVQRAAAASRIKPTASVGPSNGPDAGDGYGRFDEEETDNYMLPQQPSPQAFGSQLDGAAVNHAISQQPANHDEQQHSFAAELEAMGRSNGGNYLQSFEEQLQNSHSRLDTGGINSNNLPPALTPSPLPSPPPPPPLNLSPPSIPGARQLQSSSSITVRPTSTPQVALSLSPPARYSLSGPPVRMSDNGVASGRLTLDSPRQRPSSVAVPGMMMGQGAAMSPARMAAMQQQQQSMMVMKKQQQQQQHLHLRKL